MGAPHTPFCLPSVVRCCVGPESGAQPGQLHFAAHQNGVIYVRNWYDLYSYSPGKSSCKVEGEGISVSAPASMYHGPGHGPVIPCGLFLFHCHPLQNVIEKKVLEQAGSAICSPMHHPLGSYEACPLETF